MPFGRYFFLSGTSRGRLISHVKENSKTGLVWVVDGHGSSGGIKNFTACAMLKKHRKYFLPRMPLHLLYFQYTRAEGRAPVRGSRFATKAATPQGVHQNSRPAVLQWALAQLFFAPAFWFTRYLIVVPRP